MRKPHRAKGRGQHVLPGTSWSVSPRTNEGQTIGHGLAESLIEYRGQGGIPKVRADMTKPSGQVFDVVTSRRVEPSIETTISPKSPNIGIDVGYVLGKVIDANGYPSWEGFHRAFST